MNHRWLFDYHDVIMSAIASEITSLTIAFSAIYSEADQRKHQSSASLAFVRGIHRWPVNFSHKGPVTRKMFPSDDVFMWWDDTERVWITVCIILGVYSIWTELNASNVPQGNILMASIFHTHAPRCVLSGCCGMTNGNTGSQTMEHPTRQSWTLLLKDYQMRMLVFN